MLGVGNVANTLSGGHTLNPRQRATSEPERPTSSTAPPGGDGALAVIRNLRNPRDQQPLDAQDSAGPPIKELVAAIRAKLEEFEKLLEAITTGRFSAQNLSDILEAQAKEIRGSATSASRVYTDVSELLSRFREEVKEIRSSDEFLIGVHDKIEQFSNQAEFKLGQVDAVGEHMIDVNENLELGIFTLARVREEALKALRCQEAPDPLRALTLLKDNTDKPNAAERATPPEAGPPGQDVLLRSQAAGSGEPPVGPKVELPLPSPNPSAPGPNPV